eukprot:TRINITY_DN54_c0_g1_i2.p1 TRINITY_DN54_c0_g1~~TRINITY_DN54_c0_g1_i2.p1  ORF type:complete len:103 (+),score=31.61 TRINITY_DN54_c0_g1_i2:39-347(+)
MFFLLFFFFLMIRRPPRSTLSSSSAASDVYKRQGINAEYGGRPSAMAEPVAKRAKLEGITVDAKFPAVTIHTGFPPSEVDMAARLAGKKTIVVGLPGAFTPT